MIPFPLDARRVRGYLSPVQAAQPLFDDFPCLDDLRLIARDVDPAEGPETEHLDDVDLGGLLGLVRRIVCVSRGLHLQHVQGVAAQDHVSMTNLVDELRVVVGDVLDELAGEHPVINSPADAAALVQYEMSLLEQEYLKVILLDTRNRVLDIVEVYHGSVNSTQVRVGELFKPAIQRMAPAIVAVHNHPSGDPTPSPDDIAVTRGIVQAGKLLSIDLLDHLIIGQGRFVSMKERGLGFS